MNLAVRGSSPDSKSTEKEAEGGAGDKDGGGVGSGPTAAEGGAGDEDGGGMVSDPTVAVGYR